MKNKLLIGLMTFMLGSMLWADKAQQECMRAAAIDGRKSLQKCQAMQGAKREDCEKKTKAALAGAEKACRPAR